jgi:hypothetical protein
VVLGDAHPVEAELLDVLEPLDHALEGLRAGVAIVRPGGHRPFGRQRLRRQVARGLEERDLHRSRAGPADEVSLAMAPDVSMNGRLRPRRAGASSPRVSSPRAGASSPRVSSPRAGASSPRASR